MQPDGQDVFRRVAGVIRATFNVPASQPITAETVSADVAGWDSLMHAILIMAVEREFDVSLPLDEAYEQPNVGALADIVAAAIATRESGS